MRGVEEAMRPTRNDGWVRYSEGRLVEKESQGILLFVLFDIVATMRFSSMSGAVVHGSGRVTVLTVGVA